MSFVTASIVSANGVPLKHKAPVVKKAPKQVKKPLKKKKVDDDDRGAVPIRHGGVIYN